MATYTFRFPGRIAGKTITVYDATNTQVTSGAADANGVFAASLSNGDYYALTPDGQYRRGDSDSPQSVEATALPNAYSGLRREHLPTEGVALTLGEVPTVTFSATTTIASGTTTGLSRVGGVTGATGNITDDPTFAIGGTVAMPANAASPSNRVRAAPVNGTTSLRYVPTFRTLVDSDVFELSLVFPGAVQGYRVIVDGVVAIDNGTLTPGAGSGFVKFAFASAKPRMVDVVVNDPDFVGIRVPTTYSAVRPPQGFKRRLVVVGDSLVAGANGIDRWQTWPWRLGRLLGCDDVWNAGVGGTGWLVDGTGTTRFRNRIINDLIPVLNSKDIVVIAGSRNDDISTPAKIDALTAEVTSVLGLLSGVTNVFTIGTFTALSQNAAVKVGVLAANRPFIDASSWITGTGNTSAPANNGNADRYISSDGIHPTQAGHDYMGYRVNAAIRALLPRA